MLDVFDKIFYWALPWVPGPAWWRLFMGGFWFRPSLYRDMHSQKASRPERYARLNPV